MKKNDYINVFHSKLVDKVTGLERVYKYSDVPTDKDQWVFDLRYRPIPYDLLYLKLSRNNRVISGWWTSKVWEGPRLKEADKVIAWKRQLYDYVFS